MNLSRWAQDTANLALSSDIISPLERQIDSILAHKTSGQDFQIGLAC